jgi:ketopantoate hydroxymethyltransferase
VYQLKPIEQLNSESIGILILFGMILIVFPDLVIHLFFGKINKKIKMGLVIMLMGIGAFICIKGLIWINSDLLGLSGYGSFTKFYAYIAFGVLIFGRIFFKSYIDQVQE